MTRNKVGTWQRLAPGHYRMVGRELEIVNPAGTGPRAPRWRGVENVWQVWAKGREKRAFRTLAEAKRDAPMLYEREREREMDSGPLGRRLKGRQYTTSYDGRDDQPPRDVYTGELIEL